MASNFQLPPVPRGPIQESFEWRDWFNKLQTITQTANTELLTGVSGTFKTADVPAKTVTVTNGIITDIT
jgi:hypothetical protein